MKKNILLVLALALIMATLGCDSEPEEKKPAGDRKALIGKWFDGDYEMYEFKEDGSLVFFGNMTLFSYTVKNNTLIASYRGYEIGTTNFSVTGTGASASLKLSKSSGSKGGSIWLNGTYTLTSGNSN